jgi:rhodanese-related sulfurtransferase
MPAATVTRTSTMQEVLQAFPGAQRALFRRYHIGGCSSCGFQPTETLEQVCARHNVLDVEEVLDHIRKAEELDQKLKIKPREAADLLKAGKIKLLDVRQDFEWEAAHIEGAQLVTQELVQEIMEKWPKDTALVFHCHHGMRSLDAAAYFLGHGFTNVKSMEGGIDAWSREIDPSVPRYQM